jgi:hypothetical protein
MTSVVTSNSFLIKQAELVKNSIANTFGLRLNSTSTTLKVLVLSNSTLTNAVSFILSTVVSSLASFKRKYIAALTLLDQLFVSIADSSIYRQVARIVFTDTFVINLDVVHTTFVVEVDIQHTTIRIN